jgi:hypothetical protein
MFDHLRKDGSMNSITIEIGKLLVTETQNPNADFDSRIMPSSRSWGVDLSELTELYTVRVPSKAGVNFVHKPGFAAQESGTVQS